MLLHQFASLTSNPLFATMTFSCPSFFVSLRALSLAAFVAGVEKGAELMEANFGAEACFASANSNYQTSQFYEYIVQS